MSCATSSPRCARNLLANSVHYPVEPRDEAGMRITIAKRFCRKCGATIPPNSPQQSCSACLLEAGLDSSVEPDGGGDVDPTPEPMLMDFGDYELIEKIGRGGQGVVFRARQKSLNRIVALKVIALGHWATESHLKRFRLEAKAAASLDHPCIVPIYDIGERDGSCYFSMKLVQGGQLDEVQRREPMSIRRAAELMAKIARTVHYAHERGVLHRDIKPGNILLDGDGEPHLTDFGLARLVETESTVTCTMEVLGTPSYMAPEEAAGQTKQITAATDVYGLGAVFYQLLTGHPPFAGGTTYQTIRMVLETEPRKPRLWNPKVDVDLETICLKCLEKEPPRRYASALALAEDLERWLRHEPVQARPANIFKRTRKWIRRNPTKAILVPSLIAVAILAFTTFRNREPPTPPAGVAVLPFANLSDEKDGALLADGIQDDILTKLAKIADLKVISRTSVMQYRGERNIRKIRNALRVSHVLEGSLRKDGQRLRLNAQLIDARNDQHVWAEHYDVDPADLFSIQSEIAQTVASQLKSKVSTAEKAAIETRPTRDLEAYKLYLQAKDLTAILAADSPATIEIMIQAAELLEKAVARDPNFVLAYCLLADTNLNLYWNDNRADSSRRARAEAALRAAQRIAPDAGETHLAQALFYYHGSRDYDHALEQLDLAARLLPNSADVFFASAMIERRLGRWGEALRHYSKANEVNPRASSALTQVIVTNTLLRHYTEADQLADRAIATFPEAAEYFWNLKGRAALEQGDLKRAHAAAEKAGNNFPMLRFWVLYYERNFAEAEAVSLSIWQGKDIALARSFAGFSAIAARAAGATDRMRSYLFAWRQSFEPLLVGEPDPSVLTWVGVIDGVLGRNEQALAECQRAVELRPISHDAVEGPEYAKNLALVYAWAGERDRAIKQLSTLVKLPAGLAFGELKLDPVWDNLRSDPRFDQILAEAAKPIPLK
jgi:serine/threonine protein kinase/Tfp pilus assembly protein PilF